MTKPQRAQNQRTVLFQCLSNSSRRYALSCLKDAETPLALADLAEDIAKMEAETPLSKTDPETVKTEHLDLYHCHIPKLEDAELVHYDRDQDRVALTESSGAVNFTEMPKLAL